MTSPAAHPRPRPRSAWHNHLPRWILDHPEFARLRQQQAATLQAIADSCTTDDAGNLVRCFGGQRLQARARVSARTLNRHLAKLMELGFVVPTFVATKQAMKMGRRTLCNIYGVPARPGSLESQRATKQTRVYARRDDGRAVPQHLDKPGQQAALFIHRAQVPDIAPAQDREAGPQEARNQALGHKRPGTPTTGTQPADAPAPTSGNPSAGHKRPHHDEAGRSPSSNRAPQKCPTPPVKLSYPPGQNGRPSNHHENSHRYKNHGVGGVSSSLDRLSRAARPARCPHVSDADLRDTAALVALHARCEQLGLNGTAGEAGLLWIVSAAERSLEVGEKPAAMFAAMVNRHLWINVTQAQEERARVRLRDHLHPPVWDEPAPEPKPRPVQARELSPDARAACSAMKIAGGDAEQAYRMLQGRGERTGDAWSRERWEAAAGEAGLRVEVRS